MTDRQKLELDEIVVEETAGHIRIRYNEEFDIADDPYILLSSKEARAIRKFLEKFDYSNIEETEQRRKIS